MVTPYKDSKKTKKQQVTQMFDKIASDYDALNRVISMGIDKKWRNTLVQMVQKQKPETILDLATGTGDLALALSNIEKTKIIGLDIAPEMLAIGKNKVKARNLENRVDMLVGDAESLPFDDASIDAATVAFGVRNFGDLDKGLQEILRILKPHGQLYVLETSVPTKFPFKQGYQVYSKMFLPIIGRLFSKDKSAYEYLSDSAAAFPHGLAFNNILEKNGFIEVNHHPQTLGVVTIYHAKKSNPSG
jgi:demethylmenaquinone methyltransferase/2-methoxy-6-polyprenyl-1,4-benzoquinol methylase